MHAAENLFKGDNIARFGRSYMQNPAGFFDGGRYYRTVIRLVAEAVEYYVGIPRNQAGFGEGKANGCRLECLLADPGKGIQKTEAIKVVVAHTDSLVDGFGIVMLQRLEATDV